MRAKRIYNRHGLSFLLAILSFIWVLPIFYVLVLTSFREESGSYKSLHNGREVLLLDNIY